MLKKKNKHKQYRYSRAAATSITFDSFGIIINISACREICHASIIKLKNEMSCGAWTIPGICPEKHLVSYSKSEIYNLFPSCHQQIDEYKPLSSLWLLNLLMARFWATESSICKLIHRQTLLVRKWLCSISWQTCSMCSESRSDGILNSLLTYACICASKGNFAHENLCLWTFKQL